MTTPVDAALSALVLEDYEPDAELLLMHLRRVGYVVDAKRVCTAAAFRAAIADRGWDVILADYSMPQFTALDALHILRESQRDIPFIIVSGFIGEAAAVESMRAGAHDFFLKENLTRLSSAVERERAEARVRVERREAIQDLRESQERLRQAVRARDEFLSIASHELKTPLTTLSLQVESARLQLESPADAASNVKLKSTLAGVSHQVTRLTTLINNLLEVTRVTSGALTLSLDDFDLRDAVKSVVGGLQDALTRSGSALQTVGTAPVVGRWDRLGIESVIFNVVSNAIKFGEGKPIELEVDGAGGEARLTVTDHGIGIDPSDQERVFHRFERAVPERHFGGFGLGLWVARQTVEAHGGRIEVASKPRAGSIFTIALPLGQQGDRPS